VGITDAQAQQQPVPTLVIETLFAGEEQLANAVERVDGPDGRASRSGPRLRILSRQRLATLATWNGSATRVAWSSSGDSPHGRIPLPPPSTPAGPPRPPGGTRSAPARRVSTAWASTCSECSVQVLASQSASDPHQPCRAIEAIEIADVVGIWSWALARTPQPEQPTTLAVDSTVTTSSSGPSATSSTRNPSSSRSASVSPIPSSIVRAFDSYEVAGPLTPVVDARLRHGPEFNEEPVMQQPEPHWIRADIALVAWPGVDRVV
jgi:hypothetical protein